MRKNHKGVEFLKEMKAELISLRLLQWFHKNRRNYPWRCETDPYKILIAEIMLQRTKADQVAPVYLSFLKEFPDIQTLAMANFERIEYYLQRLGLKWRAKKLYDLAQLIVKKYKGDVPKDREQLLSLPGIGEYVADAILCFAYNEGIPIVDANVCRVIGRIFGLIPRGEARRDPRFRKIVEQLLPQENAKEFNWAMIDFAAMICTPRKPKCSFCPLNDLCVDFLKRHRDK